MLLIIGLARIIFFIKKPSMPCYSSSLYSGDYYKVSIREYQSILSTNLKSMVLVFAGISLHFIPTSYDIKDNSCSIESYIVA